MRSAFVTLGKVRYTIWRGISALLIDWPLDIAMNLRARACVRIGRPPHVGSRRYPPWIGEPQPHGHAAPLTAAMDIEPSQDRRDVLIDGFLGRE